MCFKDIELITLYPFCLLADKHRVNAIINLFKSKVVVMGESKTIVFGNENSSLTGVLASLLQRNSIDPGVLALMNNGRGCNDGYDMFWLIFLILICGGNGFGGFGGNRNGTDFLSNQINNNAGRDLLAEIIRGNSTKIDSLANMVNANKNTVQNVLATMQSTLSQLGSTINLNGEQTRHAITEGNMTLMSKYAECCCEQRLALSNLNTTVERATSSLANEFQKQTCDISKEIAATKDAILAGQRAAEMRELNRDIAERDRMLATKDNIINNYQQTQTFGAMLNPLATAVSGLQKDIDSIKCKLPDTANVPYSPVIGVPNCVAAQMGLGFGSLYGQFSPWG